MAGTAGTAATAGTTATAGTAEAPDEDAAGGFAGFGTFGGVFVPTLLTILGVIMFLRLGWVVGNAGFLGAVAIIAIAFGITLLTGLSLASITTNIRIGAGGAYSVISQSLGVEVGGSIGVPLFLSQALAVAMYIFGFREGWLYLFPAHPAFVVDLAVFGLVFGLAYASAKLAFKIQYVILVVIVGALVSVAAAAALGSMTEPLTLFGGFPGAPETGFQGTDFWFVFAVFFPAATGIMAGANMSGELADPRRSIPAGTIAAILVSLAIYLALAYWLATSASPTELVSNYTIMIDRAFVGPAVLAGLLAATLSSAIVSLVGAPRILQALAVHDVLPRGDWLAELAQNGEPRRAMLVSGGIVFGALLLRELNAIAPLITMFFLITYMMINAVVLVEQRMGLVSFRPLLRVPAWVPLAGVAGCVFTMFIINPTVGIVAVVVVFALYGWLVRRDLEPPYGDVRSGLFASVAEWAARKVGTIRGSQERTWKPNLLVPFQDPRQVRRDFLFLRNLAYPTGSVRLLGVAPPGRSEALETPIDDLGHAFREDGVDVTSAVLGSERFVDGVVDAMQTLRGTFFRPNVVVLRMPEDDAEEATVRTLLERAPEVGMGAAVLADHPEAGLGRRRRINLWVPGDDRDWAIGMNLGDLDLAVLLAVQLQHNWAGDLRLLATVAEEDDRDRAAAYLSTLADLARLRLDREPMVLVGNVADVAGQAPEDDVTLLPLPADADAAWMRSVVEATGSACVFARDGGEENALA